jgi:hypothetical protein
VFGLLQVHLPPEHGIVLSAGAEKISMPVPVEILSMEQKASAKVPSTVCRVRMTSQSTGHPEFDFHIYLPSSLSFYLMRSIFSLAGLRTYVISNEGNLGTDARHHLLVAWDLSEVADHCCALVP